MYFFPINLPLLTLLILNSLVPALRKTLVTIPIDLKSFRNDYLKQSETIYRTKTTKYLITILDSLTSNVREDAHYVL